MPVIGNCLSYIHTYNQTTSVPSFTHGSEEHDMNTNYL